MTSTRSTSTPGGTNRDGAAGTVLVTGASSGIGRALAIAVATEGWDVVVVARRVERLRALAAELAQLGNAVEVLAADLLDDHDRTRVEQRLRSTADPVDELVNNAGVTTYGHFAGTALDDPTRQIGLHLDVPLRLMHAALPGMVARGHGGVLNIASTAGLHAAPGLAAYAASKAALICLSESVHDEVRPAGVTVTCACPGYTRTELQEVAGVDASRLPASSWMDPGPVARAAWHGHRRGRALVVPGLVNRATAAALHLAPRSVGRRATAAVIGRVSPVPR